MLEIGKCPKCKSENLEYGVAEIDLQLFYPVECKNCGFVGKEWYDIIFTGFTDANGNDIKIGWEKLNNGEYIKRTKDRLYKLQKGSVGVLGIGKCYRLNTKLATESEFQNVACIVYSDDNHGLELHNDLKQFTKKYYDEEKNINLIFEIADKYIDKMF